MFFIFAMTIYKIVICKHKNLLVDVCFIQGYVSIGDKSTVKSCKELQLEQNQITIFTLLIYVKEQYVLKLNTSLNIMQCIISFILINFIKLNSYANVV